MKIIFLLLCLITASTQLQSQLLEENFDYAAGDSITQHGWNTFSGAGTNTVFVSAPGLNFPNYAASGIGNYAILKNGGQDSYKNLLSTRNTGSIYSSFMVKVDTGRNGDYFFALLDSGSASSFRGRVHARNNAGSLNFGITKAANSDVTVWSSRNFSFDSTYLIILKYTFVSGTSNDLVSLFAFSPGESVPSSEPAPDIGPASFPSSDPTVSIGRVILRQGSPGSTPTLKIDGIFIDDGWNNSFLPVELSQFNSFVLNRNVTLSWQTSAELNNSKFEIERAILNNSSEIEWKKIGEVAGRGTTNYYTNYSYNDNNLNSGKYSYRLKQIDYNGNSEYYELGNEISIALPLKFELTQNFPNPFNPVTKINFQLPENSFVKLKVYDANGKEVRELVNENKSAGFYSIEFKPENLASGLYFYKIIAGDFTEVKKMMLVK